MNGQPIQAKCGLSPHLVTEHLSRYPDVPRVVVNRELASYFTDNDHIISVHGISQDAVRSTTEHSLDSAADMLDLHLASVVPAISVVRNAMISGAAIRIGQESSGTLQLTLVADPRAQDWERRWERALR